MKTQSIPQIKKELQFLSQKELIELCLRLGKFKVENKALLTYLLFEANNEDTYIENVKLTISEQLSTINTNSYFYMKKSIRKALRQLKNYIKYSQKKTTHIELLLFFCETLNELQPNIHENKMLSNLYHRQICNIKKLILSVHEDLQFEYNFKLEKLNKT